MTKRSLLRETIIKLLEEDSKFSEGDSIITKENDKGKITLAKHPFYAAILDKTGTTHSYHADDLQIDPEAEQDMDFGKYDTTEPEQQEEPLDKIQEIKVNNPSISYNEKKVENYKPFDRGRNIKSTIYNLIEKNPGLTANQICEIIVNKEGIYGSFLQVNRELPVPGTTRKQVINPKTKKKIYVYFIEKPTSIQESAPSSIIHMDGLLTVNEELNVTDVLSDIRSITGITVVRSIDIPGESHKNKLKIKIDPYPFRGIAEDIIKQKIKTTIRKIPGVKEFWSGVIQEPLQEKRYIIIENKPIIIKKQLVENRLYKECEGLNEYDAMSHMDAEIFCELANPDMSYKYEETTPGRWDFEDKFSNKLGVKINPTSKDIYSYFKLQDKRGDWIEVYDYNNVKDSLDPNSQIWGGSDDRRSDTICKIIRDEILPKYLINNKPQLLRLHPLNDYRHKVFYKCAEVCKEKYPQIEIKEVGPYIMMINK